MNMPRHAEDLHQVGKASGLELTIEREISGDKQVEDIKRAIEILTPLL